ncbi:MAG: TlpA family protein disulfide reductase [Gammaproteobacteria bacterium]|nr:TlpA family protein disulfide reductase [Gammaproteobacteria bacterium]
MHFNKPAKLLLLLALLVLIHALFFWLSWKMDNEHQVIHSSTRFTLINGDRPTIADYKGKPLLVHFWATSCRACIREVPELADMYRALHPHGLEMIAVAMPYDRPDAVITYADKMAMPWPVALDVQGDTLSAFGRVQATPAHFLLDPSGKVVYRHIGTLNIDTITSKINTLLAIKANTQ